jgi:hypothetical protein
MLNRTNRTLSAHLNRLNLGTRTLASQASFNNGTQTLHTRHVLPVVMRAGVVGDPVYPTPDGTIGIPSIPGSPSVSPWLIASSAIHPRVDFDSATDLCSASDWQVNAFDPPCYLAEAEVPGPRPTRLPRERGQSAREPFTGKRRQQGSGLAGWWKQATLGPVAARAAAAGG